jgi:hypothetical protein
VDSDADISDTTVFDVSTEVSSEDTDGDIDSPGYETSVIDCTIETQWYYSPSAATPLGVPAMNQWWMVTMIILLAGFPVWTMRRSRPAL